MSFSGNSIIVVGPGAIGVLLAGLLAKATGRFPLLLGRLGFVASSTKLRMPDGESVSLITQPEIDSIPDVLERTEYLYCCVRSVDLLPALEDRLGLLRAGTHVVLIANGYTVDVMEGWGRRFPHLNFRIGVTNFGSRPAPGGEYIVTNPQGSFTWGPLPSQKKHFTPSALEQHLVARNPKHFVIVQDVLPLIRMKWLYNVVINSLVGFFQLPTNGGLLDKSTEVEAVFAEAWGLGQDLWGAWPMERETARKELWSLIERTSENENSLYRDLRLGRPTETPFLAGLVGDRKNYPWLTKFLSLDIGKRSSC